MIAREIARKVRLVPGIADVHVHQVVDAPELHIQVDREKADELGLTQRDIANNLLVSFSSSSQVMPNFWVDPKNGVSYLVAVQTPQYDVNKFARPGPLPSQASSKAAPQFLSNLATG